MIDLNLITVGTEVILDSKSRFNTGSDLQLPMRVVAIVTQVYKGKHVVVEWTNKYGHKQSNGYYAPDLNEVIQESDYEIN